MLQILGITSVKMIRGTSAGTEHSQVRGEGSQTPAVSLWVMLLKVAICTSVARSKLHMAPARRWMMRRLVVSDLGTDVLEAAPQVALGWAAAAPRWAGTGRCCPASLGSALTGVVVVCPAGGRAGAAVLVAPRSAARVDAAG